MTNSILNHIIKQYIPLDWYVRTLFTFGAICFFIMSFIFNDISLIFPAIFLLILRLYYFVLDHNLKQVLRYLSKENTHKVNQIVGEFNTLNTSKISPKLKLSFNERIFNKQSNLKNNGYTPYFSTKFRFTNKDDFSISDIKRNYFDYGRSKLEWMIKSNNIELSLVYFSDLSVYKDYVLTIEDEINWNFVKKPIKNVSFEYFFDYIIWIFYSLKDVFKNEYSQPKIFLVRIKDLDFQGNEKSNSSVHNKYTLISSAELCIFNVFSD